VIVLYDADCGFCRWAVAWAVGRDERDLLVTVPIQSELGSELLVDIPLSDRLRSAHVVPDSGPLLSGGAAAAEVLGVLPSTRNLGRLARGLPRTTAVLYGVLAARRQSVGRLVGAEARRRADRLLRATNVTTAAGLGRRRPPTVGPATR
jgi:predicted DCC family thiol-disulfide oxidoreductase YuxK